MRRYIFALLVFLTILVWIGVAIKYRISEPVPGATDLELVGRCHLLFLILDYNHSTQSFLVVRDWIQSDYGHFQSNILGSKTGGN